MHCFLSPECLTDDAQGWMLAQFPKRLQGPLTAKSSGPVEGWGVCVKEGWNWKRVGWILALYVVLSLLFGVVWTVGRNDIQGGFGVAGYLASTAAVFLGWVATRNV